MANLNELTIKQAHEGLAKKEFSCVELTQNCLDRMKSVDGKLHAHLSVDDKRAVEQAKAVDNEISKSNDFDTLTGVPCSIKDVINVIGFNTTAGSKILENFNAPYDATATAKLKESKAVILGKTNPDEFACGSSTENSAFGPSKNPWDQTRVPGGSSGGSAVAVEADECIYALGSDTGGSIRQPASLCGMVGLKPTYGRVSRYGLLAMASSLDQIGPMTKTVEDSAIVLNAISGNDPNDSTTVDRKVPDYTKNLDKDIKGLKIGVPKEYFVKGIDKDVEKVIKEAIKKLEELGAEIKEVSLPHSQYALPAYYIIMPCELSSNLARYDGVKYGHSAKADTLYENYLKSRAEGFGAEIRRRVMIGAYSLSAGYYDAYYLQAQKVRTKIKEDFNSVFKQVNCIVGPVSPSPAWKIGDKVEDPLEMYLMDIYTVSANIVGIPGISVPCGFVQKDGKDLPVGLQILGKHFDEETILQVAHNYEKNTNWTANKPII